MRVVRVGLATILALALLKIMYSSLDLTETRQLATGPIYVLYETTGEREHHTAKISPEGVWHFDPPIQQRYLHLKYKSGLLFPGDFCEEAMELWAELRPEAERVGVDVVMIERSGAKYWRNDNELIIERTLNGFRWFSTRLELERVGPREWATNSCCMRCDFR